MTSIFVASVSVSYTHLDVYKRQELHQAGNVRKLSHRETELLSILTENLNFTVQRRDILLRVWGDDSFFNSRNLDVYICLLYTSLRKRYPFQVVPLVLVDFLA